MKDMYSSLQEGKYIYSHPSKVVIGVATVVS